MEHEKICGIYMLTCGFYGNTYIGQSRDILRRYIEHKSGHSGNPYVEADREMFGKDSLTVSILEECDPDALDERERFWIKELNPDHNRCMGGKGSLGHAVSDAARVLMSEGAKKQWKSYSDEERARILSNLKRPSFGHTVSQETRQKISASKIGTKRSESAIKKMKETIRINKENGYIRDNAGHRKRVMCIDTGLVFESVKAAGEYYGIAPTCVSSVLKGRYNTTHGHSFRYC